MGNRGKSGLKSGQFILGPGNAGRPPSGAIGVVGMLASSSPGYAGVPPGGAIGVVGIPARSFQEAVVVVRSSALEGV